MPADPPLAAQRQCLEEHYRLVCDRFGDERGTMLMRKYACHYAQGKPGARHFRTAVGRVSTPTEFHAVVAEHFPTDDA